MKSYYLIAAVLLFLLGGSQSLNGQEIDQAALSGNIRITLQHGVWKQWEGERVSQDITLDLVCDRGRCKQEVWGYAPKFNKDVDHDGTVTVIDLDQTWQIQARMNIKDQPWKPEVKQANYNIELLPYKNQLYGSYSGTFNDQPVSGEVRGNISPLWPKPVPNHIAIQPQEHPRLIFRKQQLPALREKAKTAYGQAILTRLRNSLNSPIYYDGYAPNGGYHAAGHCFLSLLNEDEKEAETAWQIVENSMNRPGRRLLEHSTIVAGVALSYDLCYNSWNEERLQKVTSWLGGQTRWLVNGGSEGWNSNAWSNWSARARGAAGLAAMAILDEPDRYFSKEPTDSARLLKIAERNIKRYLTIGIGEHGFGTEGDHYTTEPWVLTVIPFIQAYRNVVGEDLVQGSSAEWFLPHYVMRMVGTDGQLSVPAYGRHRSGPDGSLFAVGLGIVPEQFLPGVMWFFNRHFGWGGDKSFGIQDYGPYQAAFALMGYRDDIAPKNPAKIFGRVLVDKQKGFFVFRNQWQDSDDFVASIYLKRQPLKGSWSFPDAGSFRIWGLGGHWATAGPSKVERENENIIIMPHTRAWNAAQPTFFQSFWDGSGVVSMRMDNIVKKKSNPTVAIASLRSFAVDYSGASGAPGLFVVVDKFTGAVDDEQFQDKTWVMHTKGDVSIEGQIFTIRSQEGATMQGTFVTPTGVQISYQPGEDGGTILATGGDQYFVVMTVQKGKAPDVKISGTGLDAKVQVGGRTIAFRKDRIVFINNILDFILPIP